METKEIPEFSTSLPMLLNGALDRIMPAYRELFARFNLTEQQWRVLRVLWSEDKVTAADLSRLTLLSAPSLVGILDRLENKKLIARVRSTTDRREVYIVTTTAGRNLREEILPSVGQIHEEIRARVSPQEWDVMVTTLAKLSGNPGFSLSEQALMQSAERDSTPGNKVIANTRLKTSA